MVARRCGQGLRLLWNAVFHHCATVRVGGVGWLGGKGAFGGSLSGGLFVVCLFVCGHTHTHTHTFTTPLPRVWLTSICAYALTSAGRTAAHAETSCAEIAVPICGTSVALRTRRATTVTPTSTARLPPWRLWEMASELTDCDINHTAKARAENSVVPRGWW